MSSIDNHKRWDEIRKKINDNKKEKSSDKNLNSKSFEISSMMSGAIGKRNNNNGSVYAFDLDDYS